MPTLYSYLYSSEGSGPWWGIQIPRQMYTDHVRRLEDATRLFVTLTNENGDTTVVAVEGPHREAMEDSVFAPPWLLNALNLDDGAEVMMDAVYEALPAGTSVTLKPLRGVSVESPIFLEGLTEALNQLGVVQEGLLTAVVDPSTGEEHQFEVKNLVPAPVCLADGELRVEIERAADRPPSPPRPPTPPPTSFTGENDIFRGMMPPPCCGTSMQQQGFVAFQGEGHRLDGGSAPPPRRHDRGEHPLLQKILREADPSTQSSG